MRSLLMNPMLYTAIKAIRAAGTLLSKYYDNNNTTNIKLINIDNIITNIKKNTEKIMYNIIKKTYPTHYVYNVNDLINTINQKNTIQWILNPLDGKTNFLKKIPFFSLSIVVRINNYTQISIIYNPILNELFTAARGHGAQLNNYRLRIDKNIKINTLIFNIAMNIYNYHTILNFFSNKKILLNNKTITFRCYGASSLDLAYIAAGRNDVFLGFDLQENNKFYAEKLLIRESGGIAIDFQIKLNSSNTKIFLAGNYVLVKNWYNYINKLI